MPTNVIDIDLDEVSFVGKGANQEAHVVLMKRADAQNKKGEKMPELKKLQKKFDELTTTHGDLVKTHDTLVTDHDVMKTENGDLKKKLEKKAPIKKVDVPESVQKVLDEQADTLKKQDAKIAKMEDEALTKAWIEKGAGLTFIGKVDEIGALLKSVAVADSKSADDILALLKSAQAKIETGGLFKEHGSSGEGEGNAEAQLNTLAKAHAAENNVTFEKAYSHIYSTNTELVKQYRIEKGGK